MKIDFSTGLKDFYGNEFPEGPLTLATAAVNGLMKVDPKDDGKVRFDLYNLARRIHDGGPVVEIEPKEAELIKTRIGLAYGQVIVGPAWKILNG